MFVRVGAARPAEQQKQQQEPNRAPANKLELIRQPVESSLLGAPVLRTKPPSIRAHFGGGGGSRALPTSRRRRRRRFCAGRRGGSRLEFVNYYTRFDYYITDVGQHKTRLAIISLELRAASVFHANKFGRFILPGCSLRSPVINDGAENR